MGKAFDDAWLTIAGNFSSEAAEAAAIDLANAILSVASGRQSRRGCSQAWRLSGNGAQLPTQFRVIK